MQYEGLQDALHEDTYSKTQQLQTGEKEKNRINAKSRLRFLQNSSSVHCQK